ncbi:hypothetical protein CCP3SC15_1100003 [Gammaproteobacteria bacterium]
MSDRRIALHTRFFEQFPDPLCIVGRGLVCSTANAAFISLLGGNPAMVGRPLRDLQYPAFLKQILPPLERCFAGEDIHDEVRCILPGGIPTDLRCWSLSNDGSPPHYVALSLRLSQSRRPTEGRDERLSIELDLVQRQVAEANRRNVEMKAALRHQAAQNSEAQRRKDEFLATIGHQLRNHLSPVRNAARFLHHKLSGESEVRWCITVIDRQVSQFARLIDELQDLARLESGQFELNKDRLPLAEVISQAQEWAQPLLDDQQQTLEIIQPEERPLWVDADLQRLSQALEHLIHNAAYYTGAGGHLQLSARQEETEVVITIRDNGREIPPDLLPRIFDLYGEIPGDPEQPERDPGLGLAVVRRVVELHGGTVRAVYLGAGEGNERTVRLPMAPAPIEEAAESHLEHLVDSTPTSRILVVDDNEDVAISFGALLEVLGHDVRVVLDGHMALDAVRDFMPHIVFLDIAMPDMDGYEVARRLRAEHRHGNLRLVAVTGYGQDHDSERAQRAGFDHHLLKPVDLKDLQALLGH